MLRRTLRVCVPYIMHALLLHYVTALRGGGRPRVEARRHGQGNAPRRCALHEALTPSTPRRPYSHIRAWTRLAPCPHLQQDWAHPLPTFAPVSGLAPAASPPGAGLTPCERLRRDVPQWALIAGARGAGRVRPPYPSKAKLLGTRKWSAEFADDSEYPPPSPPSSPPPPRARTSAPFCISLPSSAHPSHICTGTWPASPTSAPGLDSHRTTSASGLGPPLPHLHRDWARTAPQPRVSHHVVSCCTSHATHHVVRVREQAPQRANALQHCRRLC